MREKINRLARGVLNEEQPVLSVSPERIDMAIRRGEVLKVPLQAVVVDPTHNIALTMNAQNLMVNPREIIPELEKIKGVFDIKPIKKS